MAAVPLGCLHARSHALGVRVLELHVETAVGCFSCVLWGGGGGGSVADVIHKLSTEEEKPACAKSKLFCCVLVSRCLFLSHVFHGAL